MLFITCATGGALVIGMIMGYWISSMILKEIKTPSLIFSAAKVLISWICMVLPFLIVLAGIHLWEKYTARQSLLPPQIKIKNYNYILFSMLLLFLLFSLLLSLAIHANHNYAFPPRLPLVDIACIVLFIGSFTSVIFIYKNNSLDKKLKKISVCLYTLCFGIIMFRILYSLLIDRYTELTLYEYFAFLLFFIYLHYAIYKFWPINNLLKPYSWVLIFIFITIIKILVELKFFDELTTQFVSAGLIAGIGIVMLDRISSIINLNMNIMRKTGEGNCKDGKNN